MRGNRTGSAITIVFIVSPFHSLRYKFSYTKHFHIGPFSLPGKSILLLGELRGIPVVRAAQKDRGRKLFGLFRSKKMRVRLALVRLRAGASGVVFGIKDGVR